MGTLQETMHEWNCLEHARWDSTYHVVIIHIPQDQLTRENSEAGSGQTLESASDTGYGDNGAHLLPDLIHMCLRIPLKNNIGSSIRFIKGKRAAQTNRHILENS